MKSPILISVVIPCYNVAQYLERTIKCLASQTYQNFECICIDDGSTDNTWEMLGGLQQQYDFIRSFHFNNQGPSQARNEGANLSKGDYIYFLDADDYFIDSLFQDIVGLILEENYPDAVHFGYTPIKECDFTPPIKYRANQMQL